MPWYGSFEPNIVPVAKKPGKNLYQNRATADRADIRLNIGAEAIEFIGIEVEMIVLNPYRIYVSDLACCCFRHGFGPYIDVGTIPMQNGAAPRGVESIWATYSSSSSERLQKVRAARVLKAVRDVPIRVTFVRRFGGLYHPYRALCVSRLVGHV